MTVEELQKHYDTLFDVLTDHMKSQDKLIASLSEELKRWRDMYYDLQKQTENTGK